MSNKFVNDKMFVLLFFAVYLVIGLFVFDDYGISWDEDVSRYTGSIALGAAINSDVHYSDPFHGPTFEMLLAGIEKVFGMGDDNLREVYFMRHLVTFLLFYLGVWFFFLLCRNRFHSWRIGLLGSFLLVLSPRIFAHSFYNSKDIAGLALFIISIFTLLRFLEKKTFRRALLHALTSAILIDVRIMGVIIPVFTVCLFASDLMLQHKKVEWPAAIKACLLYLVFLVPLTVLFWPLLWKDPLINFIGAFKLMAHFESDLVLFNGEFIQASALPWYYCPVWILITTPLMYTVFFAVGCGVFLWSLAIRRWDFLRDRMDDVLFLSWFFGPVLAVIILGSTLYDGWRHMYFVYPAFILLSVKGIVTVLDFTKDRRSKSLSRAGNIAVKLVVTGALIGSAWTIGKMHPYQNVYFNRLAGKNLTEIINKFELDYWGLSYRECLEYILEHDQRKNIKISYANFAAVVNSYILPAKERQRLTYVEILGDADYLIDNFRWRKGGYPFLEKSEIYSVEVAGGKIASVYDVSLL
ncbi:MAG: glycosyltransferase family 39 protein [Proteobacteria bacterium]|nr:glycosyltransferase family 39 protein [Pseudomonadota bacterium]MBU1738381.1 glycosyltransferase family 39 protein [Pseudomonadota bacterium]